MVFHRSGTNINVLRTTFQSQTAFFFCWPWRKAVSQLKPRFSWRQLNTCCFLFPFCFLWQSWSLWVDIVSSVFSDSFTTPIQSDEYWILFRIGIIGPKRISVNVFFFSWSFKRKKKQRKVIFHSFEETGSVYDRKHNRRLTVLSDDTLEDVRLSLLFCFYYNNITKWNFSCV